MRSVAIAGLVALLAGVVPAFAQGASGGQRGAQPAAPAQPRPAPPAQTPPVAAPTAAPFPQGAKIGLVNLQQIAAVSNDGKAATAKVQALIQKKQAEGQQKSKALQENQQKLEQGGALMNEAARAALQKEIDRQTVEGQRFDQDAQKEVNELQTELQGEFQRKLFPILQQLAQEKNLHLLLSAADAGAIWWEPGIDLTAEAIKRLDTPAPKQ
jgi:Skp family chaperone for outer membrane proteins